MSCVALTKVVGNSPPFQYTAEVAMRLLPSTVRANAPPPAITLAGETSERPGTGFALAILKVALPEVPPPGAGLVTAISAVPAELTSIAGTCAVS